MSRARTEDDVAEMFGKEGAGEDGGVSNAAGEAATADVAAADAGTSTAGSGSNDAQQQFVVDGFVFKKVSRKGRKKRKKKEKKAKTSDPTPVPAVEDVPLADEGDVVTPMVDESEETTAHSVETATVKPTTEETATATATVDGGEQAKMKKKTKKKKAKAKAQKGKKRKASEMLAASLPAYPTVSAAGSSQSTAEPPAVGGTGAAALSNLICSVLERELDIVAAVFHGDGAFVAEHCSAAGAAIAKACRKKMKGLATAWVSTSAPAPTAG